MVTNAIVMLKERTGSSQFAIQKFIEEKQKNLPPNFRKLLLNQLKKFTESGKLVKLKNSYKLPSARAAAPKPAKAKAVARTKAKPAVKAKAVAKPKAKAVVVKAKPIVKAKGKKDKAVAKAKPVMKPAAKVARTSTRTTPGRRWW